MKRGLRISFGLILLVLFGVYAYFSITGGPTAATPAPEAVGGGQSVVSAPAADTPIVSETAPVVAAATPEPTAVPTPDPNSPAGRAAALGLPAPPDIDVNSWEFTLVNGDHSIGEYEPEQLAYLDQTLTYTDIQTTPSDRIAVDARVADALIAFGLGCKDAGLPVYLSSGYRSYSAQQANFIRVCNNNGVSDGKDSNGHYITMPAGCSEHQLALCCDITDIYRPIKNAEIEKTETFQWLKEHCAAFGFVVRFPAGKEDITNVMYEPFHFRYVGAEAANYMMQNGLVLEEFLALYGVE